MGSNLIKRAVKATFVEFANEVNAQRRAGKLSDAQAGAMIVAFLSGGSPLDRASAARVDLAVTARLRREAEISAMIVGALAE